MFQNFLMSLISFSLIGCTHLDFPSFQKTSSKKKVAVIVGAGGARTISALGILKELQDRQIPVDEIVGLGWGAWIAGLYAQNKSVDEVRWSFHKLSNRGILDSSFLKKKPQRLSIKDLNTEIIENFNSPSQISFSCPILTRAGKRVWRNEKFLRNCLLLPPFFKMEKESGSLFSIQEAISFLKNKGIDVIIWVDPLESENLFSKHFPEDFRWIWQEARFHFSNMELEKGVYRIAPRLKKYSLMDFSKMNLIYEESLKEASFLLKNLQKEFPYSIL